MWMHVIVCWCMRMYVCIWMCVDVCGCMLMYMDVCCMWMYTDARGCMFVYFDVYEFMLMHVDISMYEDVWWCIWMYVDVCEDFLEEVVACLFFSISLFLTHHTLTDSLSLSLLILSIYCFLHFPFPYQQDHYFPTHTTYIFSNFRLECVFIFVEKGSWEWISSQSQS